MSKYCRGQAKAFKPFLSECQEAPKKNRNYYEVIYEFPQVPLFSPFVYIAAAAERRKQQRSVAVVAAAAAALALSNGSNNGPMENIELMMSMCVKYICSRTA